MLALKDEVITHFKGQNWLELGLLTGFEDRIRSHNRLLRSLSFGDDDYPEHGMGMLMAMVADEPKNIEVVQRYLDDKFGLGSINVSSAPPRGKRVVFTPSVFEVPDGEPNPNLLSVMMPFAAHMQPVFEAIKAVAAYRQMECLKADNVWEHSTVIQDIFGLIYRSFIVVCDFSGRNPNVFYEAGIAHTLGKHVIPIAQTLEDIPFDLRHHRAIPYLNNQEGRTSLQTALDGRVAYLIAQR